MGPAPMDRSEIPPWRCHGPRSQPNLDSRVPKEDITSHDVLLGRSDCSTKHIGTIAFRAFVASRLGLYQQAGTKKSFKTHQIVSVVNSVHEAGGRFMVDVGFGLWWSEVDRRYAREKVCNTFRDAIKQLNNDNHRVWGETARFAETESFASIVAFVEYKMMEEMQDEESDAATSVVLKENIADAVQNLVEESSIVEMTTQSSERAHQGTSLVAVLNNILEDNGESEELDEEYVQFLSSLAKTTIEDERSYRERRR